MPDFLGLIATFAVIFAVMYAVELWLGRRKKPPRQWWGQR